MSITRHYADESKTREQIDVEAIKDIKDYCSEKQWDALQQAVGQVECGHLTIDNLNFMFGIAGVSGLPFHAFCRKYCLEQYRAWMADGSDGVPTDEQGFRIDATATSTT